MFNTGQVTLPKKWRDKYPAKKYIARPQGNKLVLEPIKRDFADWDKEVQDNFLAGYDTEDAMYDSL